MSDAQRFLLTIDGNQREAAKVAGESAKRECSIATREHGGVANGGAGIENKDLKLVELVQSLGDYLTDDDTTVRAKGSVCRPGVETGQNAEILQLLRILQLCSQRSCRRPSQGNRVCSQSLVILKLIGFSRSDTTISLRSD